MNNLEKQQLKRKIIIAITILVIVLIIMLIVVFIIFKKNENENKKNNIVLEYDALRTVEDVVRYYKCKFISKEINKSGPYYFDVYLEFCKLLYEEEKSNENFYTNIIKDIARISNYESFKLIDEKNDIKIEVVCKDYKIYNIIINGIEDYFIYMNSQMSLRKYKDIPVTNFLVESQIILDAINQNWSKDVFFGSRESIYDKYYIYFDEGIEVRNIDSKIYNIIFTERYLGNIVNGITPGMSINNVKLILGEPAFENKELEVVGYKGIDFYIFFTNEEISIYRRVIENTDEFWNLIDKFLNKKIDFLEMMNQLTYIWPDYSEYDYASNKVFLSYPQKGLDVKINYDNSTGIIIYNNFNDEINKIKSYFEYTEFMGYLQIDNMFEAEKRRIQSQKDEKEDVKTYKKENVLPGYVSSIYDCLPIYENEYIVKMKFISKNNDRPNREINEYMDNFLWINDTYFIFSKKHKGIYLYDLNTGTISEILIGNEEYELKSFENGILKFDENEIVLSF